MIPKVENLLSLNNNFVPNQFLIKIGTETYFQSYNSIIAMERGGGVVLDANYWDYSRTTSKYLYKFLREQTGEAINYKKDVEQRIKSGEYKLANLN